MDILGGVLDLRIAIDHFDGSDSPKGDAPLTVIVDFCDNLRLQGPQGSALCVLEGGQQKTSFASL